MFFVNFKGQSEFSLFQGTERVPSGKRDRAPAATINISLCRILHRYRRKGGLVVSVNVEKSLVNVVFRMPKANYCIIKESG